ncbi:hypothetical protein PM082_024083 [Marasmius tenuissimus]|nr:hypothetical protein PM082_024083 [Marasmius tenuissimus]
MLKVICFDNKLPFAGRKLKLCVVIAEQKCNIGSHLLLQGNEHGVPQRQRSGHANVPTTSIPPLTNLNAARPSPVPLYPTAGPSTVPSYPTGPLTTQPPAADIEI